MTAFWTFAKKALLILGILITFLIGVEIFRIFAMFYRFRPWLGWLFAAALLALLGWGLLYAWRALRSVPRALKPRPLPDPDTASIPDLKAYCEYLRAYLLRLARHARLDEESAATAREQAEYLRDTLSAHPLREDLTRAIRETREQVLEPLLSTLADSAEKEIRSSTRDVMLGVTLSPYHSIDLLIVIYRNAGMIVRVARIFGSRPDGPDRLRVLVDTLKVIATVNFLNLSRNLIESLFSKLPFVGRIADDIGQGLGAGYFTCLAGHAAIQRCTSYAGWSRLEAAEGIAARNRQFLEDVRDIFLKDVFPEIKVRLRQAAPPEQTEQTGFFESITRGITGAVDQTASMVGDYVVRPAWSGTMDVSRSITRSVTGAPQRPRPPRASASSTGAAPEPSPSVSDEPPPSRKRARRSSRRRRRPRGPVRIVRNLGQRIKYGFFSDPRYR